MTDNYYLHGALDGDTDEGVTDVAELEPDAAPPVPPPGTLVAIRFDTRPIYRDVKLGEPIVDTNGPVSICRYPITAPVKHGPITIPELELIIWADSRFTFRWEAHNTSRGARHSIAFEGKWIYRDSGHEPVTELGVPGFDYFQIPNQRWARRTRRRYNSAFQAHFHLLSRREIQAVVRVTVQREA